MPQKGTGRKFVKGLPATVSQRCILLLSKHPVSQYCAKNCEYKDKKIPPPPCFQGTYNVMEAQMSVQGQTLGMQDGKPGSFPLAR